MSGVQIVEGGFYFTKEGDVVGPARYEPGPFTPHHPWKLRFAKYGVDVRYSTDGRYWRPSSDDVLLDLTDVWDGTETPAPAESASATPAGGGGGSGEARDGGGASGIDAASTPSPSALRPPLPLPGGEETRSAAVDDFCAHIGWSPDTEITVWPLYWGGYVTYRLGDLVEAVPDTIDRLRARGRLGALGGLMERADFNRAAPALAGAFTAMADRPFRAVFHPRNAIGDARS